MTSAFRSAIDPERVTRGLRNARSFGVARCQGAARWLGSAPAYAMRAAAAVMLAAPGWMSAPAVFAQAAAELPAAAVAAHSAPAAEFTERDMLSRLNQPWVQLIDVRSADEYAGHDIRALRGGHIPGAISLPAAVQATPTALLSPAAAGLDPGKETIVYGNGPADAAAFASLLERSGFRQVRLYAAGWPTWANTLELPVTNERFADVGAMRSQIDELKRALARYADRADASERIPAGR